MNVTIYALCCPLTDAVRYVGKTIDAETRLRAHMSEKKNGYKRNWITSLSKKGLKPVFRELEIIMDSNDLDWQERERWWITKMKEDGHRLTNLEDGGVGGKIIHEKTKLKISLANKGRKPAPQTIAASVAARKGKKMSQETRLKMSISRAGRGPSPETIAASVKASKGKKMSQETRDRLLKVNTGRKRPEHEKQKISESMKKLHRTGEHTSKLKLALIATRTKLDIERLIKRDPKWFRKFLTSAVPQTPRSTRFCCRPSWVGP